MNCPRSILVAAVLTLLTAGSATAHPSHADSTSMRADVRVDEARGLRVRVYVELPTARVVDAMKALNGDDLSSIGEDDEAAFRRHMWERFGRQLRVAVDGAEPAGRWEPADDPRNGYGTREGFLYVLEWTPEASEALLAESTRDDGRMTVHVDLDALPDDAPYLSASSRAKPPWRVVSDSSAASRDEGSDGGRWSLDPRLRDLEIVFERTDLQRPSVD